MNTQNVEFNKEGLEQVALLSRLSLTENEKVKFLGEIKNILGFISQIKDLTAGKVEVSGGEHYGQQFVNSLNKNIMREDKVENQGGEYTEKLLANAPERIHDFIKVGQVLTKHKK